MIGRDGNIEAGAADRPLSLDSRIAIERADRLRADLDSIAADAERLTKAIERAVEIAGEPESAIGTLDRDAIFFALDGARINAASAASLAQDRIDALRREIDGADR